MAKDVKKILFVNPEPYIKHRLNNSKLYRSDFKRVLDPPKGQLSFQNSMVQRGFNFSSESKFRCQFFILLKNNLDYFSIR